VIVVDASAALSGLLNPGPARDALAVERLHAPHLIDSEVASGLRRQVRATSIGSEDAGAALDVWLRLGMARHPALGLLRRMWELRENLSAYDATYVALAEALGCPLLTADARLAGATGVRCPVTTVPR
jgi:predicted nucleic acid-binding protein